MDLVILLCVVDVECQEVTKRNIINALFKLINISLDFSGPPRGGMGMGRGGPRGRGGYGGGGGRFSDNGQNGFFQNQNQPENPPPASLPTVQAENPPAEKPAPATTQPSGNNVQVVTTNPPAQATTNGTVPTQQQSAPSQQGAPSHISSQGRGGFQSRGRGFGGRTFGGRGRGYQGGQSGPPRQFDTRQPSNLAQTQPNSYPAKRGGFQPGGPPGAKRGRYEGPYQGNRSMAPHSQLPPPPPQHQSAYNVPP